jgi:uncharacterized protein
MNFFLTFLSKVFLSSRVLFYFYPFLNIIYKIFVKKDILEKLIIFHNKNVLNSLKQKQKKLNKILILLPHCIQKSSCVHKITGLYINNCKICGACQVANFLKLKNKFLNILNIDVYIATGGTVARQIIFESKASLIVAIACKNDLISGIKDIKTTPTLLVLNKTPNGPCKDTIVDFAKIDIILSNIIRNN